MSNVISVEKDDDIIIKLGGNISSFVFYNVFMKEISLYFKRDVSKRKPPIISIENVDWIDSNVLPLFISLGILLKRIYSEPAELLISYNPSLLQYLETSEFMYWIGKTRLDIFEFDQELMGGFNLFVRPYNKQYKVEKFDFIPGFYDFERKKQREVKFTLLDRLERFDIRRVFGGVLEKVLESNSMEYDMCIQAIAETVCNSMLYSETNSYACVQALPKTIYISLCDVGIGFQESLKRKGIDIYQEQKKMPFKKMELLKSRVLSDFLAIFVALKYAEETERVNLWKLKKIVTDNHGTMRIHSNRIQVIFSHNRCRGCKSNHVDRCMECMLNSFSTNYRLSPLRILESKLKGVHIEIDFDRGDKR